MADPRLAPVDTALVMWSSSDYRRISLLRLHDGKKLAEWKQEELDQEPAKTLFGPGTDSRNWHTAAYDFAAKQGLLVED